MGQPARETVKVLFASGSEDLIPSAMECMQALYTELPPRLTYNPIEGLRLFGASGLSYRIESTTNLQLPVWITNASMGAL